MYLYCRSVCVCGGGALLCALQLLACVEEEELAGWCVFITAFMRLVRLNRLL